MFLSLGASVVKLDGSAHEAELAEAKGLAVHAWSRLFALEAEAARSGLKELKAEAKRERAELESYRVDFKKAK